MKRIPERQWKWLGHAQHLCVGQRCQFRMATQIGNVVVSTMGEWIERPDGQRDSEGSVFTDIGYGRKYETMVFRVDGEESCGCPKITSHSELAARGSNDPARAREHHMELCELAASGEYA